MTNNNNNSLPAFIYGTAWKEDDTERLTQMALEAGFRGIDTANQRRHYFEEGVGKAINRALKDGIVGRKDLFIQTKYTYAQGQDHRIPYDIQADYPTQVRQSFNSSLEHLKVEYLDSYVLHGPAGGYGLIQSDWDVWTEMEAIQSVGGTKYIGVSNVSLDQLKELYAGAKIKPRFVQNRCFAQAGWDRGVRQFCMKNDITYQGFSLLTANQFVLTNPKVKQIAESLKTTPAQVVFRFAIHVGMLPLTGTKSSDHMKEDLICVDFSLTEEDVEFIENISGKMR